jgi:hypothetical protein
MALLVLCSLGTVGCKSKQAAVQTNSPEGEHLRKVMNLCREYSVAKKKRPNQLDEVKEWAVKEGKATADDFLSTRDQQPYGLVFMPMGNQAVVYEQTGKDGKRFMVLRGNVVELPSAEVDDKVQGFGGAQTGKPKKGEGKGGKS